MHATLVRRGRFLAVMLCVVACSPQVTPTPKAPTPAQTEPPITAVPTVPPTSAPPPTQPPAPQLLSATWQLSPFFGVGYDAAWAPSGWVAIGIDCGGGCDEFTATAWTSVDGLTWSKGVSLEADAHVLPIAVVWSGDAFYALGELGETPEGSSFATTSAVVWTSKTGTSWTHLSTIKLGRCDNDRCRFPSTLAVTPDNVLVVGTTGRGTGALSGIFRSKGGTTWTEVPAVAFGQQGPPFGAVDAIASGSNVILGGACSGCWGHLWSSVDGLKWTAVGETDGPTPTYLQMATDGRRLVVAEAHCAVAACAMSIWTGPTGGPLTDRSMDTQLQTPRVAVLGSTFVLTGTADERPRIYAFVDGMRWREQATNLDFSGCPANALAGGPDAVLLLTSADCAAGWVGHLAP